LSPLCPPAPVERGVGARRYRGPRCMGGGAGGRINGAESPALRGVSVRGPPGRPAGCMTQDYGGATCPLASFERRAELHEASGIVQAGVEAAPLGMNHENGVGRPPTSGAAILRWGAGGPPLRHNGPAGDRRAVRRVHVRACQGFVEPMPIHAARDGLGPVWSRSLGPTSTTTRFLLWPFLAGTRGQPANSRSIYMAPD